MHYAIWVYQTLRSGPMNFRTLYKKLSEYEKGKPKSKGSLRAILDVMVENVIKEEAGVGREKIYSIDTSQTDNIDLLKLIIEWDSALIEQQEITETLFNEIVLLKESSAKHNFLVEAILHNFLYHLLARNNLTQFLMSSSEHFIYAQLELKTQFDIRTKLIVKLFQVIEKLPKKQQGKILQHIFIDLEAKDKKTYQGFSNSKKQYKDKINYS
jgi:hypothetical protein